MAARTRTACTGAGGAEPLLLEQPARTAGRPMPIDGPGGLDAERRHRDHRLRHAGPHQARRPRSTPAGRPAGSWAAQRLRRLRLHPGHRRRPAGAHRVRRSRAGRRRPHGHREAPATRRRRSPSTPANFDVLQVVDVPAGRAGRRCEAEGKGEVVVQGVLRFNLPAAGGGRPTSSRSTSTTAPPRWRSTT